MNWYEFIVLLLIRIEELEAETLDQIDLIDQYQCDADFGD